MEKETEEAAWECENKGMNWEYVRNLNHNFLRIRLAQPMQEKRYQYCMLQRGGIAHLLSCDLRHINDEAFLYYDITSMQNLQQILNIHKVGRAWFSDFLEGIQKVSRELYRFLLEEEQIVWSPEYVYQDFEKNDFCFLFLPYENYLSTLGDLFDFLLEKLDYEDEEFVEFFYGAYEQCGQIGIQYVTQKLQEDFEAFLIESEDAAKEIREIKESGMSNDGERRASKEGENDLSNDREKRIPNTGISNPVEKALAQRKMNFGEMESREENKTGKGLFSFLGSGRKRGEEKPSYKEEIMKMVSEDSDYFKVAEEGEKRYRSILPEKEENYGKTIFIESAFEETKPGLYKENGELITYITEFPFLLGKRKEEVSFSFTDVSVSRIHARILCQDENFYLEDCNATNGTFKNGLRLKPYEKRKLEKEDEVRLGNVTCIFR